MASIEQTEFNNQTASNSRSDGKDEPSWEYQLRKYLMLLATLVAAATYAAGLDPPGGVWEENEKGGNGYKAGEPILYNTRRYLAFYYFNATAFAASLVVNLLLLVLNEKSTVGLAVLRLVMVLDLLGLMGAYAAGSCRDAPTTVYASALVVALAAYVGVQILLASYAPSKHPQVRDRDESPEDSQQLKGQRKVLMLLATFATGITYEAGLSPPGGFRDDNEGSNAAGEPMLQAHQFPRLMAFFYCNTTAFVASLFVIVLLLGRRLQRYYPRVQSVALYGFVLVALFGLLGAYAAGSCREADTTAYVIALVGVVLAYIFLVMVIMVLASDPLKSSGSCRRLKSFSACASKWLQERGCHRNYQQNHTDGDGQHNTSPARELLATSNGGQRSNIDQQVNTSNTNDGLEKAKSLVLLLATLAATITYQAGIDPPGGVWPKDDPNLGHKAGDPILLFTDVKRYKVFFYCNSTAFVASLVVILMVKSKKLVKRHALEVVMILDLLGLIGAYAAGSCRDVSTSIYVVALAGAVLVYVVIHVVFFTLDHKDMSDEDQQKLEKRRKRLLLLAILVATITYQSGLTPPGGFWQEDGHAGFPVLHDNYWKRYQAFFYCNATSFMASIALIILLVNPTLYLPGIRCYALYVCMVVALFGLMGAYAAGSARLLRTSIYVFMLVGAVIAFIVVQLFVFFIFRPGASNTSNGSSRPGGDARNTEASSRRKYLMLLAILAASVTYQAGLDPPGSVWQAGDPAGNPVMHDRNRERYHAFFYSNSTSFVASIVVIVLLLQEPLQNHGLLLYAMNTAIVLDLLGLLGAYAAGSSRDWETSGYVIALVAAVLAYIAIHLVLWFFSRGDQGGSQVTPNLQLSQLEEGESHRLRAEA